MDCPWNSLGQNTGVGSLSLLQGIFPTQGLNPGFPHCRQILYQIRHQGSPRILEWVAYPFSSNFPDPGIDPGSPALQADSLPTELSGKPRLDEKALLNYHNWHIVEVSGSRACLGPAAAAESLQSCSTLCDPIDGSPPGSPIPGILQARTLEWVAISFSNA